jgi:ADP-ribose pyrophosphatase YjhB (NUDIX family)
VDVIIEWDQKIILIQRKNPPFGWAIPGGFVDYGETVEQAAVREAREEACLDVKIIHLLGVYSAPKRDPRFHTISTVFIAAGTGQPEPADDTKEIGFFNRNQFPKEMAFDHSTILKDYFWWKKISEGCLRNP